MCKTYGWPTNELSGAQYQQKKSCYACATICKAKSLVKSLASASIKESMSVIVIFQLIFFFWKHVLRHISIFAKGVMPSKVWFVTGVFCHIGVGFLGSEILQSLLFIFLKILDLIQTTFCHSTIVLLHKLLLHIYPISALSFILATSLYLYVRRPLIASSCL